MKKALLLLLLALPAAAADSTGSTGYWAGGRISYFIPGDADHGTFNPGGHFRYRANENFAFELAGEYWREYYPSNTDVHTGAFQASAFLYYPLEKLQPYVLAGAGFYASRVEATNYHRNLGRFGPHVGLGVELPFGESWSADLGWRHVWLSDIESRDTPTGLTRAFKRSGEQVTLALSYKFGAP